MAIEDVTTLDASQTAHATGGTQGFNGNQVPGIDYNHPLFLLPADVSGIQIISFQLTGIENYSLWYRSMRVALLGRNKLWLVDVSCSKEKFPECVWNHWERVNAIVLSWIMNSVSSGLLGRIMYASSAQAVWSDLHERFNKVDGSRSFNLHKEIATLSQGTTSVSVYFSKLKELWEEFEALVPAPGYDCAKSKEFVAHLQKLKLFQFFMGLNESYSQARSQILMMSHTPTVNQAYGLIISDEGQRFVAASSGLLGATLAMAANHYDVAMYTRTVHGGNQRFKKNFNLQCDFCKMEGHSKENCYKIVGYPPEYKNRKKGGVGVGNVGNAAYNVMTENNVQFRNSNYNGTAEGNSQNGQVQVAGNAVNQSSMYNNTDSGKHNYNMSQGSTITQLNVPRLPQITNCTFSKEQYEQILNKFTSVIVSENSTANAPGISIACLASSSSQEWIIYTGATNHMVADLSMLNQNSVVQPECPKKVFLPNGDITHVSHTGSSNITNSITITNVFHIPQFKYNLLSVSKVTNELKCSVAFFLDFCIYQDLFNGQVRAIGREDSGSYILSGNVQPARYSNVVSLAAKETPVIIELKTNKDIDLWHKRCGHVSALVFKKLLSSVKTELVTEK
ncbi:PREDICTED: uncharacterized protein LOC109219916 [Nicotiana attenuata]|uniref:uncharacterized protein LOC109219916 n=1 Tax=Nicotiana attenuata TaxID=49451 RepID=UPI000905A8B4|nr:PREDICTED: uncharacterized protein LOC109219916 [Nicotiana attenuata]